MIAVVLCADWTAGAKAQGKIINQKIIVHEKINCKLVVSSKNPAGHATVLETCNSSQGDTVSYSLKINNFNHIYRFIIFFHISTWL